MPDDEAKDGTVPRTVVVGVDGSDISVSALAWACGLADTIGASVVAVTTWQWPMGLGPTMALPTGYDPAGDARAMLDDVVQHMGERFPAVSLRARIVEGHASEALVEASRHSDLLVVGGRGHGAFSGMLLGSVSQHCAAHCLSPVVIYREPRAPDPT